jgi:hypothetical protein
VNIPRIAQELTNLADSLYAISEALTEQPARAGTSAGVAAGVVSPPGGTPAGLPPVPPIEEVLYADELEEKPAAQVEYGSERVCPIHHKPMKPKPFDPSVWGCTQKGTDPAWTNPKGYCTITSKNVAQYLRIHAPVPA